MANNGKPPRIYISAVESNPATSASWDLDIQAGGLLARLPEIGYDVTWQKQWRGYDVIEQDIASSNALLAVVDRIWMTSAWMAIEVYYASGNGVSGMTSNSPMLPIPIFMYPVVADLPGSLLSLEGLHFFARDVDEAMRHIIRVLPVSAGY